MASGPMNRRPMRLAAKGEAPTLEWARWVESTLRRLIDEPPPRQRPITGGAGDNLQFQIYGVRYDATAEAWFCKVRPGYVRTINPDADATEVVKDWMPTVGSGPAVPLDDEETPEVEIADGQTVYCRVATTPKGIIEEAPKIEAADTPENGTHFQPPNSDIDGNLYLPIASFVIEGDPETVAITQIQQGGPIEVTPNLPEHKNIGSKREVSKGRTAAGNTYDFRTLEQLVTTGAAEIIKPLEEDAEEGDTIQFRNILKDNSGGVPYSITGDGDSVKFKLEGSDDTYSDLDDGSVIFAGGLATTVLNSPFVPEDFDIEIWGRHFTVDFGAEDVTSEEGTGATAWLYVRRGRVYRTNPDAEPADPPWPVFKIWESSVST